MDKELLTINDLCKYLSITRTALFIVRRDDENFPKPLLFNKKQLWKKTEIDDYLERTRKT